MIRYVHTNLVAKNVPTLVAFYKDVLGCRSIGQTRDLSGDWVERLTGIKSAHIFGEHLALPGYDEGGPTLEIFGYDEVLDHTAGSTNATGFTHLAFLVDDAEQTLQAVLARGGKTVGELVRAAYPGGKTATFVYATDPEGNILELQSWS